MSLALFFTDKSAFRDDFRNAIDQAILYIAMAIRLFNTVCLPRLHQLYRCLMTQVHFRQTIPEDYEDVLSIRKHLNGGFDYLPGEYHDLLKHRTGVAGFIGNEMIAFMLVCVIDDGDGVVMQAARIREAYASKRIFSQMKRYAFKLCGKGVYRSVMCTTKPAYLQLLQQKGARIVFQRNVAIFKTMKPALKQTGALFHDPLADMRVMTPNILERIFISEEAKERLFPENRIVIECVPYQLVISNIRQIFNSKGKLLASTSGDIDTDLNSSNIPKLISATTSTPCEAGTVVYLDFFGEINDRALVSAHILEQLTCLQDTCNSNVFMYVTYGLEQPIGAVYQVLSRYSWTMINSEIISGIEETI
ncbi:histidine N-acetyltransferase-like [Ylistrum balloti]|uniref:histidine N-acetyltransferase-like n=1 Tax=Ylistrum balloti TaxID=509963 RepID=UPI00290585CE|nr:histidine N-acetyltransferase-like [Ylistrum balloti]